MIRYAIAYTPKGSQYPKGTDREYIEFFYKKEKAIKVAQKLKADGNTDIFVDAYEGTKGDELSMSIWSQNI